MGVIAKYKFDNTLEANLLPEFNSEFTSDLYTVTDEVDGEVTTRTIESDSLPTLMMFGADTGATDRQKSLLEVYEIDLSNLTSMSALFGFCTNLSKIERLIYNATEPKIKSMYYAFAHTKITEIDISDIKINTDDNNPLHSLFYNCAELHTIVGLEIFDHKKFKGSCVNTFSSCPSLTSLDLSNWDTSNVTNMQNMFNNCSGLTSLNLSNWNTSNVTNMSRMFCGCNNLTSLDVSNFDTSNVTDMQYMFDSCKSLTQLDVGNWDTSKVTDMNNIFNSCNVLKYVKCNNVNTLNTLNTQLPAKISDNQGTIICKSDTTNLDITALQSKYWNILDEPTLIAKYVFDKSIHNNCIPIFNTKFEGYFIEDEVVEGNNEVTRTIESCGMLPTLIKFTTANNQGLNADGRELALLHVEYINNTNFNTEYLMFRSCSNLVSVKGFVSNIMHDLKHTFTDCNNLITLDLINSWDTSRVTDMSYLFYDCHNLTSLDLSNWDTSQVTNMSAMFYGCYNLTSLDLNNWDSSPINIHHIFYDCKNLMTLDISNFNMINATDTATNMFYNTPLLTDISVLYMDKSSLQKLVDAIPTDSNKTLWYKDVNIDGITRGNNITLKKYMEENVEIVLNSPLLEGDTIEVINGKLCHYHKRGMVVFDGSEDEDFSGNTVSDTIMSFSYHTFNAKSTVTYKAYCNNFKNIHSTEKTEHFYVEEWNNSNYFSFYVNCLKLSSQNKDGFKQWLQQNPTTVIYELAEPYYEDITNLQSVPTLKTYLECSMEIDTDLPIDTNITYRTNLSSVYVMERELDELDNGTDLGDILEGEVNE